MLVSELINVVKRKSFGADEDSDEIYAYILDYINEAHVELYDSIANLSEYFLKKETLTFSSANKTNALSPPIKSSLSIVDNVGISLREIRYQDFINHPTWVNDRMKYFVDKNSIIGLTYNFPDANEILSFICSYVPECARFKQTDDLNHTYPLRLQYLLADGAFYRLCFGEEGTRPIRQQDKAAATWQRGLLDEQASLLNSRTF